MSPLKITFHGLPRDGSHGDEQRRNNSFSRRTLTPLNSEALRREKNGQWTREKEKEEGLSSFYNCFESKKGNKGLIHILPESTHPLLLPFGPRDTAEEPMVLVSHSGHAPHCH